METFFYTARAAGLLLMGFGLFCTAFLCVLDYVDSAVASGRRRLLLQAGFFALASLLTVTLALLTFSKWGGV